MEPNDVRRKVCLDVSLFCFYSGTCKLDEYYRIARYKLLEKLFLVLIFVTFLLSTAWLYSWSVLSNNSSDINEYLHEEIGSWFQWYIFLLVFSVLANVYILLVLLTGLMLSLYSKPLHLCICHKVAVVTCCIILIVAFPVVSLIWPDKNDQWNSIGVSFEMTGPFLQIFGLMIWITFGFYVVYYVKVIRSSFCKLILCISFVGFLVFLLTIPIWMYSPCIGQSTKHKVKPRIFGHKGAPTRAPENTMFSFEKAFKFGVYGYESDVRLSSDGVPFLMHDSTLQQTTNVAEVFPDRKHDRAESFAWAELQKLNAGSWYLKNDPFLTNSQLTEEDKATIKLQKIPSLSEWAAFAATTNKSIIFDLVRPFYNHSNYNDWVSVTVQALLESGIQQEQVLWLAASHQNLSIVEELAPGFRFVLNHVVHNASAYGFDIFNLLYASTTEQLIALNYSVISYTVDSSWTFSRAWCQGVWAVTSNYCDTLGKMSQPSWILSQSQYLGIWISVDILFLFVLGLVIYCNRETWHSYNLHVVDPAYESSSTV